LEIGGALRQRRATEEITPSISSLGNRPPPFGPYPKSQKRGGHGSVLPIKFCQVFSPRAAPVDNAERYNRFRVSEAMRTPGSSIPSTNIDCKETDFVRPGLDYEVKKRRDNLRRPQLREGFPVKPNTHTTRQPLLPSPGWTESTLKYRLSEKVTGEPGFTCQHSAIRSTQHAPIGSQRPALPPCVRILSNKADFILFDPRIGTWRAGLIERKSRGG